LTIEEINQIVTQYEEESKALKKELFRLCWFMRGGLTVEQAYMLEPEDRVIISEIIKVNLEVTKVSKLPFF
jgi:hypothetical protein